MKQTILSAKQSELLENLIAKHGQIVTFDQILSEAEKNWGYKQTKNLITKLSKNGWLIRIKKGLYAISDLSTRGFLSLSPYVVASLLVPDSYVSFEAALQFYGMFDQLTDKTISVSLRAYKNVKFQNMEYSFVKTKPKLNFGWQETVLDNRISHIATPEKALIDVINFHKNKYAIDLVIEKLREYKNNLDLAKLMDYLAKFSFNTIKIFGFIFDLLEFDSSQLHKLVKTKNGTHFMLAGDQKFNAKWRLYYDPYFDKYKRVNEYSDDYPAATGNNQS